MALPFRLVLITDWARGREVLLGRLERALAAGPGLAVQHRHPGATARAFYDEGRVLAALCARFAAPLFVNGRLDVALALDAHLHLPARALAVADARPLLPAGRWISVAVHAGDAPGAAAGADLALVAPVFPPGSKPHDARPPLGAAGFAALARALPCPAFALGGLTARTAPALRGAAGAATVTGVTDAADPRAEARALLEALGPAPIA